MDNRLIVYGLIIMFTAVFIMMFSIQREGYSSPLNDYNSVSPTWNYASLNNTEVVDNSRKCVGKKWQ